MLALLVVLRAEVTCRFPAFAPSTSEVEVAVLVFLYLLAHNLPPTTQVHGYFWSLIVSFILLLEETFVRCEHCRKGSQVQACLMKGPIPDPFLPPILPIYQYFISLNSNVH